MEFEQIRLNMLKQQIIPFCLIERHIAELFANAKREQFIVPQLRWLAYADTEIILPNTTSKMFSPKIEAVILKHLELNKQCKVLEIGSGSGYLTYLMSALAKFVYSFESNEENSKFAIANLASQVVNNVSIMNKNGFTYAANYAPFERILVGGAVYDESILMPLKKQLAMNGILLVFVGDGQPQHLVKITRINENDFTREYILETQVEFLVCNDNKTKFIF